MEQVCGALCGVTIGRSVEHARSARQPTAALARSATRARPGQAFSLSTVLCYCLLLCNQKCCSVHQNHFPVQCRSVTLPEV